MKVKAVYCMRRWRKLLKSGRAKPFPSIACLHSYTSPPQPLFPFPSFPIPFHPSPHVSFLPFLVRCCCCCCSILPILAGFHLHWHHLDLSCANIFSSSQLMLSSSVFNNQSKNIVLGLPLPFFPCVRPSNVILSNESCLRIWPNHLFCETHDTSGDIGSLLYDANDKAKANLVAKTLAVDFILFILEQQKVVG